MLICVDGTGPWSDAEYAIEFRYSFVRELYRTSILSGRHYWRGPSMLGLEVTRIVNGVMDVVRSGVTAGDLEVHLTGYSRGGHTVIEIAQEIAEASWARSVTVPTMTLFDAVDRDILNETDEIPGNVGYVFHALRSPEIGSRSSFGNTGRTYARGVNYSERVFRGTHAALGGTPWTGDHPTETVILPVGTRPRRPFISQRAVSRSGMRGEFEDPMIAYEVPTIDEATDRQASSEVHDWIWGHLRTHNVVS